MKKDHSDKIKKLTAIAELTKTHFVIVGILSVVFMLGGGVLAAIVTGLTGYEEIIRIVISIFLFGITITSLFADLYCAAHIGIAIIRRISGTMKLRHFISTIVAYGLALLIPLIVGFSAAMYGVRYLVDPTIVNSVA